MNANNIPIEKAVQYCQALPLRGVAYVFASDGIGNDIASCMTVHRGIRIKGLVIPDHDYHSPEPTNFSKVPLCDLKSTAFDYILLCHPTNEESQADTLLESGVPAQKIIRVYSDKNFPNWVSARKIYEKFKKTDLELEDLLAYQMEGRFLEIAAKCSPYTVTSLERMFSLYKSIEYIAKNNINGDFVECGVWNGGSAMLAALSFIDLGVQDREIYLFDTFSGMTCPSKDDVDLYGTPAKKKWESDCREEYNEWCYGALEKVEANMNLTGYPKDRIHYIQGDVEKTLPGQAPDSISILRLDTDWYASTRHELEQLFPRIVKDGILIIDDYGHWGGAKKAVDEYFSRLNRPAFLHRIDYTGRVVVKSF